MTTERLAKMRAEHVPVDSGLDDDREICNAASCWTGFYDEAGNLDFAATYWPCDTGILLAELDRRDHQAPVPHLATFTNGWTTQPVTGGQHRRWMAEHDAATTPRTFADVVEKVTGLREHDGTSCCDWATDGSCPWSSQGIQVGLCGPSTADELAR